MKSTINEILSKIESLNADLREEYTRLSQKYGFSFQARKIIFLEEVQKRNKSFRLPEWKHFIPSLKLLRYILSAPFIYGMIIPAVFLDICITLYQHVAFRLYGIPLVDRKNYIVYDRRFLNYLNLIQKIHCLYCSYVNGLFAYSVEIAARTERFWCPLKAAHKPKFTHAWYHDFADYGNPEEWNKKFYDEKQAFFSHDSADQCFHK
jgi:hypothetical protein